MTQINNNKNLNIKNISFGQMPQEDKNTIDNTLSELKDNMLQRCVNEVPEYGSFARIQETLPNKDESSYAGNISLICESSEDNPEKRYLSYNQQNPQNARGLSCLIASGDKEDILEALQDKNILLQLKEHSDRMSDKMKILRW